MDRAHWRLFRRSETDLINHLCAIRGFSDKELIPDYRQQLHDPNLLPDMGIARKLVKQAVKENWFVTVYGDYDADGTPAAALLSTVLDRLAIRHQVILPTRTSGYGLNIETIEEIKENTQLLITVDTGVTAVEEITRAKELGIKVIVLDHHLPKDQLPPADALVDPFLPNSNYPFPYLCGCALAYKLAVALSADFPDKLTEGFLKWLLDIVAISTVADMMPLIGENRVIVHYGLQVLAKTRRPGLIELLRSAKVPINNLSSYTLGYVIGPRLNASGRLEDNRPAFELLVANNSQKARELADQIERANQERQELVKSVQAEAEKIIWQQNNSMDRFIVVSNEGWPTGVLGLVAGKLAAQHSRPVAVLTIGPNGYAGSARSIEKYSLIDGLNNVAQYLTRFGGHNQAAGLATNIENYPKFVDAIKQDASKKLKEKDLIFQLVVDAQLNPDELSLETARSITKLAPFGHANPNPIFYAASVNVLSSKKIGSAGDHLKLVGQVEGQTIDLIGFNLAEKFYKENYSEIDVVGSLDINRWNNQDKLQLKIKDFRPGGTGVDDVVSLPNG